MKADLEQLRDSIQAKMRSAATTSDDLHWLNLDLERVTKLLAKDDVCYTDLTKPLLLRLIQLRHLRGWHFQSSKGSLVRLLTRAEVHSGG